MNSHEKSYEYDYEAFKINNKEAYYDNYSIYRNKKGSVCFYVNNCTTTNREEEWGVYGERGWGY